MQYSTIYRNTTPPLLSTQTYHWLAFNTDLPLIGFHHRLTTDWLSTQTCHWLAFNTDLPQIGFQHRLMSCCNSRTLWQCCYKYAMWRERKHMNLLFFVPFLCMYFFIWDAVSIGLYMYHAFISRISPFYKVVFVFVCFFVFVFLQLRVETWVA